MCEIDLVNRMQDCEGTLIEQRQGFMTALQNQIIAGMNLTQQQFSVNRGALQKQVRICSPSVSVSRL
jgi:hypothetical protein